MKGKTAAFFRVEGVLVRRGVLAAAAYHAGNAQGFAERVRRLGQVAIAAPAFGLFGQSDRRLANRLVHLAYRGMSEDRVMILGEEYYDGILKDSILDKGLDLIRRCHDEGHRIVLLSESLEHVITPLSKQFKVPCELICNRLEFKGGEATGRLLDPIVGGHDGGKLVAGWATENGVDLARSVAYAAHGPDLLLLAAVGQPCAVNPDRTLRCAAREAEWPVMDYHA